MLLTVVMCLSVHWLIAPSGFSSLASAQPTNRRRRRFGAIPHTKGEDVLRLSSPPKADCRLDAGVARTQDPIRVFVYGMQSSGASTFVYWLGESVRVETVVGAVSSQLDRSVG